MSTSAASDLQGEAGSRCPWPAPCPIAVPRGGQRPAEQRLVGPPAFVLGHLLLVPMPGGGCGCRRAGTMHPAPTHVPAFPSRQAPQGEHQRGRGAGAEGTGPGHVARTHMHPLLVSCRMLGWGAGGAPEGFSPSPPGPVSLLSGCEFLDGSVVVLRDGWRKRVPAVGVQLDHLQQQRAGQHGLGRTQHLVAGAGQQLGHHLRELLL